jgi:hypothetical protein
LFALILSIIFLLTLLMSHDCICTYAGHDYDNALHLRALQNLERTQQKKLHLNLGCS